MNCVSHFKGQQLTGILGAKREISGFLGGMRVVRNGGDRDILELLQLGVSIYRRRVACG